MSDVKIGLIGGSGLGELLASEQTATRHEVDTPFGKPSDAILESDWHGLPVFFLSRHGPGHLLRPSAVPYRANIFALKKLGVTHILASGAVGSLRQELKPRDLVIADQVIDKTNGRPSTFFDKAAVHVEFAEPFCPVLRQMLIEAGSGLGSRVSGLGEQPSPETPMLNPQNPETRDPKPETRPFDIHPNGCYVAMEGPAFSTRAESLMHRLWGGDLIGMTAMPEAKLAKEAEISYALVALVTDYDCWKKPTVPKDADHPPAAADPFALLNEIIANLKVASANAASLMKKTIELIAANRDRLAACPAQHALRLAIWSDKAKIDPEEQQRLGPLWLKYFVGS
jgi:5'-methylthioadenosine phosphorylase